MYPYTSLSSKEKRERDGGDKDDDDSDETDQTRDSHDDREQTHFGPPQNASVTTAKKAIKTAMKRTKAKTVVMAKCTLTLVPKRKASVTVVVS